VHYVINVDEILVRRGIVLASVLVYWGGVWVQARRVRRHIGRTPNVAPQGLKERTLWLGWSLVVIAWLALPFVSQSESPIVITRLQSNLLNPVTLALGLTLVVAGYAGTLWCYSVMGDHWRMGIDREGTGNLITRGPYRVVRHPIYMFQMMMLAGTAALLPSFLPILIIVVHLVCVLIKALDEETYLTRLHGDEYRAYLARTGRLLPPLLKR
jgi:protein-S-isoprenylcysteine O-methyltransferase Ste14